MECRFSFYDRSQEICQNCDIDLKELCMIGKVKRTEEVIEKEVTEDKKEVKKTILGVLKQKVVSVDGDIGSLYKELCEEFPDKNPKRLKSLMYTYLSRLGIKMSSQKKVTKEEKKGTIMEIVKKEWESGSSRKEIHEVLCRKYPERDKKILLRLVDLYLSRLRKKTGELKEHRSIVEEKMDINEIKKELEEIYERLGKILKAWR